MKNFKGIVFGLVAVILVLGLVAITSSIGNYPDEPINSELVIENDSTIIFCRYIQVKDWYDKEYTYFTKINGEYELKETVYYKYIYRDGNLIDVEEIKTKK
jgi:hypothetical protein